MKKKNHRLEEENNQLKEQVARLEEENERLKKEVKKNKTDETKVSKDHQTSNKLDIFQCNEIDELSVVKTVGRGAQSEVFEVSRDQQLILKVLLVSGSKNDSEAFKNMKRLFQEYEILHLLNHFNIIRTYGFCFGDEEHSPSILLEFCPKNLNQAIIDMSDIEKVCCIFEICLGMEAVHAKNVIHRDLKPENILIDAYGHVKISDFGISCYVDIENQTNSKTAGIGTLKFMAPELLKESTHYDCKVDIYSFGVVIFFILTGKLPSINIIDQGNGKKAAIPKKVNKISRELINKCWAADPIDRPSFTEIIEYIKSNKFKLIDGVEKEINEINSFLSL